MKKINTDRKLRRKMRVSNSIRGTTERPRVAVHRTNKYIYAQVIDDVLRKTVVAYSSLALSKKEDQSKKMKKSEQAKLVGVQLAKLMIEKKVQKAVFDRSAYTYLGRVKALAEGLREGGISV